MIPGLMMEGVSASSAVADVITMVMSTIGSITANPLVAAAVALPITGGVIGLSKRIFRRT